MPARRMNLNTKAIGAGLLAGAAAPFAQSVSPTFGPAIALAGVGAVMKNDTLQTLGALQLGSQLAGASGVPGGSTGSGGLL